MFFNFSIISITHHLLFCMVDLITRIWNYNVNLKVSQTISIVINSFECSLYNILRNVIFKKMYLYNLKKKFLLYIILSSMTVGNAKPCYNIFDFYYIIRQKQIR